MKKIRTNLRTPSPQTPEAFTYDDDGNLTGDGLRIYGWDAENRLASIEIRTNVITDSTLWQRVTCDYDYQHRRVRKQVYRWNPGASQYLLSSSLRFLYDGWNLIGQVDEVTGMRMSFLWGADLSGSLQGAGGVGGLKAIVVHNGSLAGAYFCQYDANGNVLALVHADTEQEAARYEYGPFGELIRATGTMAALNPFRFSTKYQDDETGLNYYGYRYYTPGTGMWPNRDPIQEAGGPNLYCATANDAVNKVDVRGLTFIDHGETYVFSAAFAAGNTVPTFAIDGRCEEIGKCKCRLSLTTFKVEVSTEISLYAPNLEERVPVYPRISDEVIGWTRQHEGQHRSNWQNWHDSTYSDALSAFSGTYSCDGCQIKLNQLKKKYQSMFNDANSAERMHVGPNWPNYQTPPMIYGPDDEWWHGDLPSPDTFQDPFGRFR